MAPCSDVSCLSDSGRVESVLSSTASEGPLHSTVISDSGHFTFHSTCSSIITDASFQKLDGHTCAQCTACADSSVCLPLGERPSCEGKEDTTILDCTSYLESDWDNSALDASCTTCVEREFSLYDSVQSEELSEVVARPMKHLLFMKHTVTCPTCVQGKECPIAQAMEQDMSSFFEVELGDEEYDQSTDQSEPVKSTAFWTEASYAVESMQLSSTTADYYSFKSDPTKTLKDVNLNDILASDNDTHSTFKSFSSCESAVTTSSDSSQFMEKALYKLPVTGHKCCKKSAILRKMKQFTKFIQNKKNGQNKLKTLFVL